MSILKLGLIYGSTRPRRFCDVIANWAVAEISRDTNFAVALIDPAAPVETGSVPLREAIAAVDCFVVITPEYNHGYPAPLKALIDSAGAEWHRKPVAFVSYGGVSGGLRAVEQLRQVFAELHAATIAQSVSFASAWELFDGDGDLVEPLRAERASRSMAVMLAGLRWWAVALKNARNSMPYPIAG